MQSLPITEMLQRGSIHDVDVLRLRGAFHNDGFISADEAEALFTLNETCQQQDPAWAEFYIEALTDHLVSQVEPEGYLTAAEAKRLTDRIAPGGVVARKSDLDLIVNVLDKSRWSPVSLSRIALQQVKRAVIDGDGPLREAHPNQAGTIRECEVELIRRILYAFGGDGHVAITRPEAEVLFRYQRRHPRPAGQRRVDRSVRQGGDQCRHGRVRAGGADARGGPAPRCVADGGQGGALAPGIAVRYGFLEPRCRACHLSGAIR
ncbi:MAG: hypothetical protein M5U16_16785 [Hyphomicrobium sp.]|nr:hypothetical protein [Hyphomicrobium sp.]